MEKSISLVLTAHQLEKEKTAVASTAVIYDVLRASSTIITALALGAKEVIPVLEPEDARVLYEQLAQKNTCKVLLGGERNGEPISGFHLGNSPLEYTPEVINNTTVIITTTNGTRALFNSQKAGARNILIGGILNQTTIASHLKNEPAVTIVCAGVQGAFAFEDFLAAGLMLDELLNDKMPYRLDDAAMSALGLARGVKHNPALIAEGHHGRRLIAKGKKADVDFCATVNKFSVLPVYHNNKIVLSSLSLAPDN
ncbi:MAG: 2-phosphosulfolactate phosphatase [Clostridia bacterium]|nr:2-phosphosulfolactate phosphatase [Clostridia bacterium]